MQENNSPLWTLKYCANTSDELKETLDNLFTFTKTIDGEIQQSDICKLLNLISENYIDLSHLIINTKKDQGLNCYLLQIKDANIKEEELPALISYLEQNLQENKAFWEESGIKQLTWKWIAMRNTASGMNRMLEKWIRYSDA